MTYTIDEMETEGPKNKCDECEYKALYTESNEWPCCDCIGFDSFVPKWKCPSCGHNEKHYSRSVIVIHGEDHQLVYCDKCGEDVTDYS